MVRLIVLIMVLLVGACSGDQGELGLDSVDGDGSTDAHDLIADQPGPDSPGDGVEVTMPDQAPEMTDVSGDAAADLSDSDTLDVQLADGDATELDVVDQESVEPDGNGDTGGPCAGLSDGVDADQDGLGALSECLGGTSDDRNDTDGDGVFDGAEIEQGTSPTDPGSALAWHPELTGVHPRLYFAAEDLPMLQERWADGSGPLAGVVNRVKSRCQAAEGTYSGEIFDNLVSRQNAGIAQACAFQALIEGSPTLAHRAAVLLSAPYPDPVNSTDPEHYDLHEAEALVYSCAAYDFLAANPGLLAEGELTAVEQRLADKIEDYDTIVHSGATLILLLTSRNNHSMKVLSALGLCGMALNNRPKAAKQVNEAYPGLYNLLLQHQGNSEGGYAEGWHYLNYGGVSFLPFVVAHRRYSGGQPVPYKDPGLFSEANPQAGKLADYDDISTNDTFIAMYKLALWSALPNGLTVNTDDANSIAMPGGLLAGLLSLPEYLWNWTLPAVAKASDDLEILTIAMYPESVDMLEPTWPTDFSVEGAGVVVFRSDWSDNALFALLQAENGPVSLNGVGHEHSDPGNFMIYAYGEYLVPDPGYISWAKHDKVMYGKDHNIILVDGQNLPRGFNDSWVMVESWLTDYADTTPPSPGSPTLLSATVAGSWSGTDVERTFVRVDQRYFVVSDVLTSQTGVHAYTWQVMGNGGVDAEDGTFGAMDMGGEWVRPKASVRALVVPTTSGEVVYGSRPEEFAVSYGAWNVVEMLTATAEMDSQGGFLGLILPAAAGTQKAQVQLLERSDGLAAFEVAEGESVEWVVLNRWTEAREVTSGSTSAWFEPGLSIVSAPSP